MIYPINKINHPVGLLVELLKCNVNIIEELGTGGNVVLDGFCT